MEPRIHEYLDRLERLAMDTDEIGRFYLFLSDDTLYELEQQLSDSDSRDFFYSELLDLYGNWRRDMGEEKWEALINHNESLNGANQNHILYEVELPSQTS